MLDLNTTLRLAYDILRPYLRRS